MTRGTHSEPQVLDRILADFDGLSKAGQFYIKAKLGLRPVADLVEEVHAEHQVGLAREITAALEETLPIATVEERKKKARPKGRLQPGQDREAKCHVEGCKFPEKRHYHKSAVPPVIAANGNGTTP